MNRTGARNAWAGYAFEQVCLHHIRQIKSRLGITGVLTSVYAWESKPFTDEDGTEWKGGQIDLIIDRKDGVMNLCEMKYSQDEFVIDKELEGTIRNRSELFRKITKTKKDLRCTMITVYGLKPNQYSSIADDQITIKDLFV